MIHDPAGSDVDHCDLVAGREGNVGFLVVREGDADGFVKARRFLLKIYILDRGNHGKISCALWSVVDHADGIGDVIGDPNLLPVWSYAHRNGIDTGWDAHENSICVRVDDVEGVGGGIGDEYLSPVNSERIGVRAEESWMTSLRRVSNVGRDREKTYEQDVHTPDLSKGIFLSKFHLFEVVNCSQADWGSPLEANHCVAAS